ncbi:MAG: hypothetical protein ABIH11_01715 [Candidatus Altiarchaeota archaeon]
MARKPPEVWANVMAKSRRDNAHPVFTAARELEDPVEIRGFFSQYRLAIQREARLSPDESRERAAHNVSKVLRKTDAETVTRWVEALPREKLPGIRDFGEIR